MDLQKNKQLVEKYFDTVNKGAEQGIVDLVTDDFVFMSMHRAPEFLRFKWNKDQFAAAPRLMSDQMKKPIVLTPATLTAEDDRVAAEATSYGEMNNGKTYANAYHFLFKIRGDKIAEVREYSCSYTAQAVFGEYMENFSS